MNPWFQDSLEHTWKLSFISMPFYCHEILLCASDHRPPSPSACSDVYPWLPVKWVSTKELKFHILDLCKTYEILYSERLLWFLFWNAIRNDESFQTKRCPCQRFGVPAILCLTCSRGRPMHRQMDDLIRSRSSCSPVSGIVPHVLQEEAMHGGPYGPEID